MIAGIGQSLLKIWFNRYATELEVEMRTDAPDGLVSWLGLDQAQEDYLGLGLDDGLVKVCPGFFGACSLVALSYPTSRKPLIS